MTKSVSKMTFLPFGGTANRMRTIASAVNLAHNTGVKVEIVWFKDWAMRADFEDMFLPFGVEGVTLRKAKSWEYYTLDRPRRKNFFLPLAFIKLSYDNMMLEEEMFRKVAEDFDFDTWTKEHSDSWLPCCMKFGEFNDYDGLIQELFHPVKAVMDGVERNTAGFSDYTIGLHIRRTDNADSIKYSPISAFYDVVDKELQLHPDLTIYLATDDEETKKHMLERYGKKVITPKQAATRESVEGVQEGMVDMWTLSRTQHIYGSVGSSFSEMAASIGNTPLTMVKKSS